ncbi:MAG TPA: hypothetical protein VH621_05385 [Nitrososphaera sp.]|jgi:hypothetical protein
MMGGGVKVPGPSKEEKALQAQQAELLRVQTEILQQQRQQQAVLLPFLAEQEGFQVETDDQGNITKISKTPSELDNMKKELETQLTQRSLDALAGNLPVSPGLEKELTRQETTLREKLAQQFGPGYETSTPGIQALGDYFQNSEVLREGARTGMLSLAEQLGISREQQNQYSQQSSQDFLRQIAVGDPLTFAGAFGQVAAGYGKAQEPYIQQRQMQLQASIANAQSSASMFGAGIGLIGSLFSDDDLKEDIEFIGVFLEPFGIPVYEYTYDGQRVLGVLASDVMENAPGYVGERMGYRTVQYEDLHGGL